MTAIPKAPGGLTARSRKLWGAVLADHELSPAELEVLRCGLVSLDRADEAAKVLEAEGVTVADRYGSPKAHPAADIEARSRAAFARAVAQLGLKLEDDRSWDSPATTRARRAANVRWSRERAT